MTSAEILATASEYRRDAVELRRMSRLFVLFTVVCSVALVALLWLDPAPEVEVVTLAIWMGALIMAFVTGFGSNDATAHAMVCELEAAHMAEVGR